MRITCETLEDFLENLTGHEVYQDTIWVNRTTKRVDSLVTDSAIEASAVIVRSDESEAIIQWGQDCGHDLDTADGHRNGTEKQVELYTNLQAYATPRGLKLLPGILSE